MKGLVIKDLLSIKQQGKVYFFLISLWMVMAIVNKDASFFQGFAIILCSMMPITALAYDERAHFEKYALTMPLTRKDMVVSKYLFGLVCICIALVVDIAFEILLCMFSHSPIPQEFPMTLSILFGIAALFLSVNLPIMFKFGTEKGRILYMALAVLAVLIPTLEQKASVSPFALTPPVIYSFPFIMLAVLYLSSRISISIYGRKEFS